MAQRKGVSVRTSTPKRSTQPGTCANWGTTGPFIHCARPSAVASSLGKAPPADRTSPPVQQSAAVREGPGFWRATTRMRVSREIAAVVSYFSGQGQNREENLNGSRDARYERARKGGSTCFTRNWGHPKSTAEVPKGILLWLAALPFRVIAAAGS
ncbi:hypothetical protein MRX96_010520 [Rhipicephalus microplus]